ncbi:TRAP-type C4-dicarboxylate transport system, substrate-binding protein [Pseudooceanicola antarcticus]|uniref:ABC transporter substrate-binding protein n=1 Tax=Pseudooceanicola antarcticus TaxID=1247613 RepID=A0A285IJP6_9RHOB|nr:TRAP transporter substrate-binding protein DctP [Pseudooceanicola antarcticus]PJE28800.1 ABC transporter substrate-binding protein [Pseudooceanicola antarcticus]SNY48205.1 TRAP-type C4-dicarboxylate transport system, substrate-binding protein [Pseudooceanicola antarcticus]
MKTFIKRTCTYVALLGAGLAAGAASAAELRLSVETPPGHLRNRTAEHWAELIEQKTEGSVTVSIFPAAQLYKSADAVRALASGALDMSIQANPTLSQFEPNLSVLSLPAFYGASGDDVLELLAGPVGDELWDMVGRLNIHVPEAGPFLYAPNNTAYTAGKQISSYEDLSGVKLATPPSPIVVNLLKALGAAPQATPRSEIVLQLSQGQIDGLGAVTDLTIMGGKLWEAGIDHVFVDNAGWGIYIPLISQRSLDKLSKAEQAAIEEAWAETVGWAGEQSAADRAEARSVNESHGITYTEATPEQIESMKATLLAAQADIVKSGGMDADFVERADAALNGM